jgi:hypothetical protein
MGSGKPALTLPVIRLVAGLAILPAFALQTHPLVRVGQAALFIVLCTVSGRRFKPLFPLSLFVAVVTANLLLPVGTVLCRIGAFPVTQGALRTGVMRAAFFIGLVYLSRFSVGPGLSLPGHFGRLVTDVFYYFERLTESKPALRGKNMFAVVDGLLLELGDAPSTDTHPDRGSKSGRNRFRSIGIAEVGLICLVILNWGLLFFGGTGR